MEPSLVGRQAEHRQLLHFGKRVVAHPLAPYRPVAASLGTSFLEMFLEVSGGLCREDFMQAFADAVNADFPKRVSFPVVVASGLEVHEKAEFRQRTCHQPPVTAQYIAAHGLDVNAVTGKPRSHLHPVFALHGGYVHHPEDDEQADGQHRVGHHLVSLYYFLPVKQATHFPALL